VSLDRKLDAWIEAGLVDKATADSIRAHESASERPTALWAISGLGLLALVLGILLVISANWDRIADWVKLSTHMALLCGAAAAAFRTARAGRPWASETALFLTAMLVLGGIALHAQVYQLTGPAWHAFLLWLALAGPALLIGGQTRLTGTLFAAMALAGPVGMAVDTVDDGGLWRLAQGAAMAAPGALIALSLAHRQLAPGFRLALRETGIVVTLGAASIAHFAWASTITPAQAMDNAIRLLPPAAIAILTAGLAQRSTEWPRALLLPLIVAPVLATTLALAIPHPDHMVSRLVGVTIFIGLWASVAQGAATSGWNALFAVAVAAIGLRIFIIYIELFGSLAATGGGLILGGALVVGLTWLWNRIVRARKSVAMETAE